jgi:hypothetical protein
MWKQGDRSTGLSQADGRPLESLGLNRANILNTSTGVLEVMLVLAGLRSDLGASKR